MKWFACVLFILLGFLCAQEASWGVEPELQWTYEALSNLYAPPLVADIHPSPGQEIILSDSEVRRLRCVDAKGSPLWEYDGRWKKRLTSAAALSMTARPGMGTLAIGNSDGWLACVDAATGSELWRRELGKIEWGGALWVDLNADGRDEMVVAGESTGIYAMDAEGRDIWFAQGVEEGIPFFIRGPMATADIDADNIPEIFALDRDGPICLTAGGSVRWRHAGIDDFNGAPVIADADGNGDAELYCCSSKDNLAWAFNAADGSVLWRFQMATGTETVPGSGIALGDLDGDGIQEIVLADIDGRVYCLEAGSGTLRWVFSTEKRTHAAITLGDVDGDGSVNVLAASMDHYLYCLDPDGVQIWRYPADLRLLGPPTLCDVDGDGQTDILFGGSDHKLRCLTLHGRYDKNLIPWPFRRFDAAQSGSSFNKGAAASESVLEPVSLFLHGGFEQSREVSQPREYKGVFATIPAQLEKLPRGWIVEQGGPDSWGFDAQTFRGGKQSGCLVAGNEVATVATEMLSLDRNAQSIYAEIYSKHSGDFVAFLRLIGDKGVIWEYALQTEQNAEGWNRHFKETELQHGARWAQLVLRANTGVKVCWDDAKIEARVMRPKSAHPLVNQVGYDTGAPKRFTVQANFISGQDCRFNLVDETGKAVFSAPLHHEGRITGAFGNDWGYEYYRGDFTAFDTPGRYRICVALDGVSADSWPFEIGEALIWNRTIRPAYRFFYYQRCGMEIPGIHKACHLDDAMAPDGTQVELWGGWHDAGDYNTYDNAPYLWGLAYAYSQARDAFADQDEDGNGLDDFFDELLWGGDHTRRMVAPDGSAYGAITSGYGYWGPPDMETDNIPGTGDERPIVGEAFGHDSSQHAAALAYIARYAENKESWVATAKRAFEHNLSKGRGGPVLFAAALNLYLATGEAQYADHAKALFPPLNAETAYSVIEYDKTFGEDHSAALSEALKKEADAMLEMAGNPFGYYAMGSKENPNYFGTSKDQGGWHVGTSTHLLSAARRMAVAAQYHHDPRYLAFVYDQINWTLGNNPFDISLMEGQGSAFLPSYHQHITFGGVKRGAIPGGVVNGVTWRGIGDDRPFVDMSGLDIPHFESNEVWLPHNTAYINALVQLREVQMAAPK